MKNKLTLDFKLDNRGVSPVIGVILMVAITVILAAVIGAFVLNLGGNLSSNGPTAQMTISDDSATFDTSTGSKAFDINHNGGDQLKLSNTKIQIRDSSGKVVTWDAANGWAGGSGNYQLELNGNPVSTGTTSKVTTGDQLLIKTTGPASFLASGNDYTVTVIDTKSGSTVATSTVTLN